MTIPKRRSDRKHRQTLRLPAKLKLPVAEMAFNLQISENHLICRALEYALNDYKFTEKMEAIHPPRRDTVWLRRYE